MTKPYCNDLRQRAVDGVISGQNMRVVAKRFGVAVSSVVKWHQRYRQTGSVELQKKHCSPLNRAGLMLRGEDGAGRV